MEQGLKAKWCEALRSGKYQQGRRHLNNANMFCCLGVLIDITHPGKWVEEPNVTGLMSFDNQVSMPTYAFEREVELSHAVASHLAEMNDGGFGKKPQDFNQIADWIEANL